MQYLRFRQTLWKETGGVHSDDRPGCSVHRCTVMKCSKVKKLVHRMVDGDLSAREMRELCEHLRQCDSCAKYYQDIAAICDAARVSDPDVPDGFTARWKTAVAQAQKQPAAARSDAHRKWRLSRLVPAVACAVLGVFVISTALVNPQAFGLGGESLRSEQATVTPSETAGGEDAQVASRSPIVFENVVLPSRVPKPATQNEEYWEQTVWSSASPSQVVTGDIEPPIEEVSDNWEQFVETPEPDAAEQIELIVPGEATIASMRAFAEDIGDVTIDDSDDGLLIEGAPERIALFLAAFGYEDEAAVTMVHITCENAD